MTRRRPVQSTCVAMAQTQRRRWRRPGAGAGSGAGERRPCASGGATPRSPIARRFLPTAQPVGKLVELPLHCGKAVRGRRGSPTLLTYKQRGMLLLVLLVREQTLLLRGGEVVEGLQHRSRSCDVAKTDRTIPRCQGLGVPDASDEAWVGPIDKVGSRRNAPIMMSSIINL